MARELTESAKASKLIRKELKKLFPTTKFSVKSDNYSMGSSVDIRWQDEVPQEPVQKVVKKYQYGHFNGMEDIYEYSNTRKDIPQAKFVQTQREMSEGAKKLIKQRLQIQDENAWNEDRRIWNSSVIWQEFNKTDFRNKELKEKIKQLMQ